MLLLGLLAGVFQVLLFRGLLQPSALKADVPPKKQQRMSRLSPEQRRRRWRGLAGQIVQLSL